MKSKVNKKCSIKLPILICKIILVIIIVYIIYVLFSNHNNNNNSNIEKFIDQYDNLAPVTQIISDVEWTMLYNKIMKNNPTSDLTLESLKTKYTSFITKEEINNYLENGAFQWSEDVKNKYRTILPTEINGEKVNMEELLTNTMGIMPNRYAYNEYLKSPDIKESLISDFYLIYTGEKPVPTKVSL